MIAFNVEYIIPDSIPVDQEELKPIIELKLIPLLKIVRVLIECYVFFQNY